MAVALYFAIAPFMGHGGAFGIAFISWLIWMFFAEVTGSRIMTRYIWKYVLIAGLELANEHPENERFKHFLDDEWVKESTKVVSSWWFLRQFNKDKWSPVHATSPWNYVRRPRIEDDTTAK